jgi:hypothetical protein
MNGDRLFQAAEHHDVDYRRNAANDDTTSAGGRCLSGTTFLPRAAGLDFVRIADLRRITAVLQGLLAGTARDPDDVESGLSGPMRPDAKSSEPGCAG